MANHLQPRPTAFFAGLSATCARQLPGSGLPATHDRDHAVASQLARYKIPVRSVLCGHTHMPRVVQVGKVTVVNPGSIGMPAYTDKKPVPHAIETGTPHARYAVITREANGGWSVDLRAVIYDWDQAAQQARANSQPVLARWIATGRA
ncbi:metallophosphoesterase family protein [Methylobacterium sp. NPDC080182]|uniref:metallophosphoesterase family protein n=1 Tax=Methylobacterium sp. NPDC080182 TaxID=3390590 RepID=UPI003CFF52E3